MYKTKNDDLNEALKNWDQYTIQQKISLLTELSVQLIKEEVPEEKARIIINQYQIK